MAKSLIGGAFGMLHGSIGSVTYTTSSAALDGKRRQIARQKATTVRNPNTTGQILQRMKLGPAQRFYDAFESIVSNGIMSHSFEGVEYGAKSRSRFMQLALQGDPKVYVPKGINYFVPGEYQVSEGSLAGIPILEGPVAENAFTFEKGRVITATEVSRILEANKNLNAGDQITILAIIGPNYSPAVARIILRDGAVVESTEDYTDTISLVDDTVFFVKDEFAAGAVIVSRGTDPATAKRSTSYMELLGDYKNLLSAEALEAAIASYQDDVTYNSFNSDWYLNNGSSQAYNGRVQYIDQVVTGNGDLETDKSFVVGVQLTNGRNLVFNIITSDGTAEGSVYMLNDNAASKATFGDDENTPVTGSLLRAAMVADGLQVATSYVKMTEAIAEQGGYSVTL